MTRRTKQVAELIRHELSRIILEDLGDPRIGFVTLTRVEVTTGLRAARVFVSILGSSSRQRTTLRGLNSARRRIRADLGERLVMRRTPEITFHLDEGVKHSIRISSILSELARERGEGEKT